MPDKRIAMVLVVVAAAAGVAQQAEPPPLSAFYDAQSTNDRQAAAALETLRRSWHDRYTPMIIDMARLLRPASAAPEGPGLAEVSSLGDGAESGELGLSSRRDDFATATRRPPSQESRIRARLLRFLEQQTGKHFDPQLRSWRTWMWSLPYDPHPDYAAFKGAVYSRIDRRMTRFFPPGVVSDIRLDEIDWGGVVVNGIPPLIYPTVIPADAASYLKDGHAVFGVVVNGQARAYPKRILAWHEMARDRVGGVELHVVYCTLCGTVIPYESVAGGRTWRLGTSGLLYRSNKLMFDEETASLWSTLEGRPVVGELVGRGLQLNSRPVVTTTWGEWRAEHPDTTVLSLDTGHQRDYAEGAAYRDYFSHDDLYFQVPGEDRRLRNKAEVLTLRVRATPGAPPVAVALAQDLLKRSRVYPLQVGGRHFVVITSRRGANRAYATDVSRVAFQATRPDDRSIVDANGVVWRVTEEQLVPPDPSTPPLPRVPAQRAFWFGWRAQYPDTILFK